MELLAKLAICYALFLFPALYFGLKRTLILFPTQLPLHSNIIREQDVIEVNIYSRTGDRFSVQDYLEKNILKPQNPSDYIVKYKFHQENSKTEEECSKISSLSTNPSIMECKNGDEIVTVVYGATHTFYHSHKSKEDCVNYINPILSLFYSSSFDINRNELNNEKIEIGITYMYPVSILPDIKINTSKIEDNLNKNYINSNTVLPMKISSNILPYSEQQFKINKKHYNILHQYILDEISNNLPLSSYFCNDIIIVTENEEKESLYYDDNMGINIIPISRDSGNNNNEKEEKTIEGVVEKHILNCLSIKNENKELLLKYPSMINDVIYYSLFKIYKNELITYELYLKDVKSKWFYISVPKDSYKILKEVQKIINKSEKESKMNVIKNMNKVNKMLYSLLYSPEFAIHQPSLPPYHIFALLAPTLLPLLNSWFRLFRASRSKKVDVKTKSE